jgi:hypothetical protein
MKTRFKGYDLLSVCELYEEGKINLWEATKQITEISPLDEEYVVKMLHEFKRDNVINFPTG